MLDTCLRVIILQYIILLIYASANLATYFIEITAIKMFIFDGGICSRHISIWKKIMYWSLNLKSLCLLHDCPYMCVCVRERHTNTNLKNGFFPVFNCPVWVTLCPLLPHIPVHDWQEQNSMWSPAVVAHLPQGSTWRAFWDAFLLTTIASSNYLIYHNSNQSGCSALTFLTNTNFLPAELSLTGWVFFCLFFHTILCKH